MWVEVEVLVYVYIGKNRNNFSQLGCEGKILSFLSIVPCVIMDWGGITCVFHVGQVLPHTRVYIIIYMKV